MKHLTEVELVMALDGELEPDELQRAVEHLAECDECRGQWEKLQSTSAIVAEYQKSLYPQQARGRDALTTAGETPAVLGWSWSWGFAAVAAMVLMALGVNWYVNDRDSHPSANNRPQSEAPKVVVGPQATGSFVANNVQQDDGRVNNVKPAAKRSKALKNTAAISRPDLATDQYTELPFSDASLSLDDATVVRVSMPAAALRQAGVPVSEDNATAMLQADVVLGVDGLPRGIRLVKNPVANHAGTN